MGSIPNGGIKFRNVETFKCNYTERNRVEFKEVSIESVKEQLGDNKTPRKVTHTEAKELDVKTFDVVDPDTGEVVGHIDAPLDYCDLLECPGKTGLKHPMGFINPLDAKTDPRTLWVHSGCMKPTQAWWAGQWRSMVYGGKDMPWDQQ